MTHHHSPMRANDVRISTYRVAMIIIIIVIIVMRMLSAAVAVASNIRFINNDNMKITKSWSLPRTALVLVQRLDSRYLLAVGRAANSS